MIREQLDRILKFQDTQILEEELQCRLKAFMDHKKLDSLMGAIKILDKEIKERQHNINLKVEKLSTIEKKLDELDISLKQLDKRMYSGEANTVKELTQLQEKKNSTKVKIDHMETIALKLMEELEVAQKTFEEEKDNLKKKRQLYDKNRLKTQEEIDKINKELSRIQLIKQELLKGIPSLLLEKYYKIKKLKKQAVAFVTEGKCSGCRMGVSVMVAQEVNRRDKIVYCENCGRILV